MHRQHGRVIGEQSPHAPGCYFLKHCHVRGPVIALALIWWIINHKHDQFGLAIASKVCNSDASPAVLPREPVGHGYPVAPPPCHGSRYVHIPANFVIALVLLWRIIDLEYNEFGSAVAIQVCNGNSSSLI